MAKCSPLKLKVSIMQKGPFQSVILLCYIMRYTLCEQYFNVAYEDAAYFTSFI